MKAKLIYSSVIFILVVSVGFQWFYARNSPQIYFRSRTNDSSSAIASLQNRVGYIEGKIGIESHEFEFLIPKDKKLIVTFVAEHNGKHEPTLSRVWHIPPSNKSENKPGSISIRFFAPPFKMQEDQDAYWEIGISGPGGNGHGYKAKSPFTLQKNIGYSTSVGSQESAQLEVGKEYKAWDYHKFDGNPDKSMQRLDFKYKMSFKISDLNANEKLDRIRIDEFPVK